MKYNTESFIQKAKEIHSDKYDYSKVEYIGSQTKICIICPKHGEFWQRPADHLRGCGCWKCGGKKSQRAPSERGCRRQRLPRMGQSSGRFRP